MRILRNLAIELESRKGGMEVDADGRQVSGLDRDAALKIPLHGKRSVRAIALLDHLLNFP